MEKLTYNEFAKAVRYKKPHRLMKLTCSFTKEEHKYDDVFRVRVKLFWFIILFIPACIIEFFERVWTDVIMDFDLPERSIGYYRFQHDITGD